jgi:NTP pyrophosphatase (non-canonical NTP hydrolase)
MTMTASGISKLIEECGELVQVLGKKLAYWFTDAHPDGKPLKLRIEHEIGDVQAACDFVTKYHGLSGSTIAARRRQKLELFERWQADPTNNRDAIDRPTHLCVDCKKRAYECACIGGAR